MRWILLIPLVASAAPYNVRIVTTATQAIITATPSCGNSFSIAGISPASNDANEAMFPGSTVSTTRTIGGEKTTIGIGQDQSIVLGLRGRAYRDAAGVWRDRVLQTDTTYTLPLVDCSGTTTITFKTKTPRFGNSWSEPFPADPDVPGQYAWPTITTPTGYATNNEQVRDPQTGVLVNRVTASRAITSFPNSSTGLPKMGWVSDDSRWVIGASAVYTADGTANAKLYIPIDLSSISGFATQAQAVNIYDYIQAVLTVAATPDDRINVCLTKDGVNCAPDGLTLNHVTTSSATAYTFGGTLAYMASWFSGKTPSINTPDMYRCSTVATNASGVLTRTSGDYFSANLVAGSSVWISGTRYRVTANNGPFSITIASPPADGSYTFWQPNVGVLVWQNSLTIGDTTTISISTFNAAWSFAVSNYLNGAYMDWASPTLVSSGYRIWFIVNGSSQAFLGWLNPVTAAANLLGWGGFPFDTAGFGNLASQTFSGNFGAAFDPNDATAVYGLGRDSTNSIVVAKVQASSNAAKTWPIQLGSGYQAGQVATNLSPTPYTLLSLIHSFNPLFDTAVNTTCSLDGLQGQYIMGRCGPGNQDNMPGAWIWVWDTTKGTAGSGNNPVVGTFFSNGSGGCRYCVLHGLEQAGNTTWIDGSLNCAGGTGTCRSTGTFTAPLFTGAFNAQFGTHLGLAQAPGDTTITVDAQPTVTNIAVGDIFQVGTGAGSELEKVTGGSYPTFTVLRGYNQSGTGSAHLLGDNAMGICTSYGESAGDAIWWDFLNDPYGTGALGTTIQVDSTIPGGHRMFRPSRYIEQNGSLACTAVTQTGSCTAVRDGAPPSMFGQPINYFLSNYGIFAGIQPMPAGGLHPHLLQQDQSYSTDVLLPNPYAGHTVTKLGGKTWLYQMTITLNRKRYSTTMFSGEHPLVDISGPGSVLNDNSSDNYKYCVAAATDECLTGSTVGDVYANLPPLSITGCAATVDVDANNNFTRDWCGGEYNAYWTGGITQATLVGNDQFTERRRRLVAVGLRYHRQVINFDSPGSVTPLSEIFSYVCQWCDGQRGEYMTAILPSLAPLDSEGRNNFCNNCTVHLTGPASTASAWVKFGYVENGTPSQSYCGSRRETCVANATVVDQATPYQLLTTDSPSKLSCASGCTIGIPVLPEHIAYWYPEYYDGGGNLIGGGPTAMQVLAAP